MKLRKNEWWMVMDPAGFFLLSTASGTRRGAIRQWCEANGFGASDEKQAWKCDTANGFRCVKCEIKEQK